MKPDHNKIAAFILTHGRPDKVKTYDTLLRRGWTKPIYLIIDNEDPTGDEYRERFGPEQVIEFDKAAVAKTFDTADTSDNRKTIVYARNACWKIAEDLGLDYHWQLDDDYNGFYYRTYEGTPGFLPQYQLFSLDEVVDAMMTYLDCADIATVATSQGGDHIGASPEPLLRGMKRKAMNSFVLRTDRKFDFVGRINEDVNTYVTGGTRGELFFTFMNIQLDQGITQSNTGGMSDVYLASGTYLKSFYTVMMAPASATVQPMGMKELRLHHRIAWGNTTPMILSDRWRKRRPRNK